MIFSYQKDFDKGLEYINIALEQFKDINDSTLYRKSLGTKAILLKNIGDIEEANKIYIENIKFFDRKKDKRGLMSSLGNLGTNYLISKDYDNAIKVEKRIIEIAKELDNQEMLAKIYGNHSYTNYMIATDPEYRKLKDNNVFDLVSKERYLEIAFYFAELSYKINKDLGNVYDEGTAIELMAATKAQQGECETALSYYQEFYNLNDSVKNVETQTKIAELNSIREKEVAERELKKSKNEQMLLIIGIVILIIFIFVIYWQSQKTNALLLNILPKSVAKRLSKNSGQIADFHQDVSVVFIDIVNFTEISSNLKAVEVLSLLNNIFDKIDQFCKNIGLEKIKTIGDSYMAVAGLPEKKEDHVLKATKLALEIITKLSGKEFNDQQIDFRIGIDSGPVVAGVIGKSKFIYDVWGDTVNTASRMETSSLPGRIQITERFKEKLESKTDKLNISERGEIEIKGKGVMKTYFIDGESKFHSDKFLSYYLNDYFKI